MAKQKEKKNITLEEKLNNALVPSEEQPYEVPSNWVWVDINSTFTNITSSKNKVATKDYLKVGKYAVIDQGQDLIGGYSNDEDLIFKDELPIIIFGDHTRCLKYINFPFIQGADGVKVLKASQIYNSKALFYSLKNLDIPNLGYRRHFPILSKMCLPLPPFPEQKRIVDLIERLFAKLDEAKEKVQTAIDSFELRKAAILHKGFTGELTAKWRERNGRPLSSFASQKPLPPTAIALGADLKMRPHAAGEAGDEATIQQDAPPEFLKKIAGGAVERSETEGVLLDHSTAEGVAIQNSQFSTLNSQFKNDQPYPIPETWQWVKLQDLCLIPITDGTHQTPTYCEEAEGVPFISSKDVTSQHIKWDKIKYITKDLHEELYKRIAPQRNDILLAKNGTTGVAAMVETDKVFDIYVTLAVLRPNTNYIIPKYLYRVINSLVCKRQFDEHLTGIGVPNLHLRDIKVTNVPLPPLAEQKEIVRILDTLLAKSDKAKELAENALENIETLKKTILAKAFRGLLGTNRAEEASSVELLKQVL